MPTACEQLFDEVRTWAKARRIEISQRKLPAGKAGEFDGLAVTMNHEYGAEERLYYAIHALGSIVLWSMDRAAVQAMFDELRDAKEEKETDPIRLERAVAAYRKFETESSEFAVALLHEIDAAEVVRAYSNFMRADLEAMTEFHRCGRAPVWRTFFARWNEEVAGGRQQVACFPPRPIPRFEAVRIENQEILQQQEYES